MKPLFHVAAVFLLLLGLFVVLGGSVGALLTFTPDTPANNSFITLGDTFIINASVSGFNWTNAFLNFSNNITTRSMTRTNVTNTSSIVISLVAPTGNVGFFLDRNDSTANVSIIYSSTGGSSVNVSMNNVVIGSISSGTFARFDGVQTNVFEGNNNLSFIRTGGSPISTTTITFADLNVTNSDYEFASTFTLGLGYYNFTYVVEHDGTRNSTGRRYVTIIGNNTPYWSNPLSTPSSPVTYSPLTIYNFSTSWNDTDSDIRNVTITHTFFGSPQTFPSTSNASSIFSYLTGGIAVGTYSWVQTANDAQNNTNTTTSQSYTINRAAGVVDLTIMPFTLLMTGGVSTIRCKDTNNQTNTTLKRNGVVVLNPDISVLVCGTYLFNCSIPLSQNYTAASATNTLTIEGCTNATPPFVTPSTGILSTGKCPNETTSRIIVFIGIMLLLIGVFIINELFFKIPLLNAIVGIGIIFYGYTMIGCSSAIGTTYIAFGVMMVLYSVTSLWR